MLPEKYNLLAVVGPTASGKTGFAAHLAAEINGEIISADSRQVYRRMDIGTGKDYGDYIVDGKHIPVHLTDIADPGYKYSVTASMYIPDPPQSTGVLFRSVISLNTLKKSR